MKSKTTSIGLTPLLLLLLFPSGGCVTQIASQEAQMASMKRRDQLLKHVQRFTANDNDDAAQAWQELLNWNREKLVNDLNRIATSLDPNDRNRVFIAFTLCRLNYDYFANRAIVLSSLDEKQPFKDFGGDWAVGLVGRLLEQGDKELLVPLFLASLWSDGAMSSDLGSAYSRALAADPDGFLRLLDSQQKDIRENVIELLGDHSLTDAQILTVKLYLAKIPPQSELHPLSVKVMRALGGPSVSSKLSP